MNPEFTEEQIAEVLQVENSESISRWQDETFGYQACTDRVGRLVEEFAELRMAVSPRIFGTHEEQYQRVADECVDMVILLAGIYEHARLLVNMHTRDVQESKVPLDVAVDYKMAINRLRKWKDGQHV